MTWESLLADKGYRITASRRAVMAALESADAPLDAGEALALAQRHHPRLGLVTVYRALDLFQELGLVRRVHRENGCHAHVLASPGHHHAVVCRRCGRADEFAGCEGIAQLIGKAEQETGFHIDEHMLQLSGICQACRSGHSVLQTDPAAASRKEERDALS